ncbi:unnamed protein product [Caenorhabditis sp. 36 PRJEB53466]|nr:unnamed protein product [Caenorhabditis sp. 36 PRJEB53466]
MVNPKKAPKNAPKKQPVKKGPATIAARRARVGPKRRRTRPGTVAIREIRRLQKSTELLIARKPFEMLVKEIAQDMFTALIFRKDGLTGLQEAAEAYLVGLFKDSNSVAEKEKRVTVKKEDMEIVRKVRREIE